MRGFPVNGDPKPAELSRPPENPPPELGYRCAQGRRLDLVDNCFWYLGDIGALANVRFAPIVLQKSFLGDERNFLGPLMRFVCGDVRDLIVSHKNDHGPSHRRYRALQR